MMRRILGGLHRGVGAARRRPPRTPTIRTGRPTTSRTRSSSKASWCSSSTATRTRSCTSTPDENGASRSAGRSSGAARRSSINAGVTRDSLKIGDEVVITARPSRVPGEYRALMVDAETPVGRVHLGQQPGQQVD